MDAARDGDRVPADMPAELEHRVEHELQRRVRGLHVERVERRALLGAPGHVGRADASAGEVHLDCDGVVERIRRTTGECEQTALGRRLDRCDRAGERDLEVDVVARELEQEAAARSRVGEPRRARSRSRRAPSVGPKLRLTSIPGCVPRSSARSSPSTSSERHW